MKNKIKNLKKIILETAYKAQEGHIASAYSILDILFVLYNSVMKTDNNDKFILSKGQASLALYAVLVEQGLIDGDGLLNHYCEYDSDFGGHPDRNKVKGVIASTGSLGHGLAMSVGLAMSESLNSSPGHIYCLIGDGEANEGSIWEAALLASNHQLSNLTCIVDYNHSTDRALNMGDIGDKFETFGWQVLSVNGHDHPEIKKALLVKPTSKPLCIIANTIKGNGCKTMENNPEWHHKAPNDQEYPLLLKEIEDST